MYSERLLTAPYGPSRCRTDLWHPRTVHVFVHTVVPYSSPLPSTFRIETKTRLLGHQFAAPIARELPGALSLPAHNLFLRSFGYCIPENVIGQR